MKINNVRQGGEEENGRVYVPQPAPSTFSGSRLRAIFFSNAGIPPPTPPKKTHDEEGDFFSTAAAAAHPPPLIPERCGIDAELGSTCKPVLDWGQKGGIKEIKKFVQFRNLRFVGEGGESFGEKFNLVC